MPKNRLVFKTLFTADHPKMYENTCFIIISFAFIVFFVFLSSILVFFLLFVFLSYFLYSTCPKALTQSQALVSGMVKRIYQDTIYIFFLPETSACGRNAVFHYAFHIKPQFSKKNRSYIWMDFYKLKKNRDKIMKK